MFWHHMCGRHASLIAADERRPPASPSRGAVPIQKAAAAAMQDAQGGNIDQASAERMLKTGERLQWQHVQDHDRQPRSDGFGSSTSHLTIVAAGWAVIVGGSVAQSVMDPAKKHLLISHRLIHARIVAQWFGPPARFPAAGALRAAAFRVFSS